MLRLPPLTQSSSPKIPPPSQSNNRKAPRREHLGRGRTRPLKAGGSRKADLNIVDLGQSTLVVKDFAAKAWWVRWIGRIQISRECRAYQRLGPLPGLVRFVGRIDAYALALEWIDGEQLYLAWRGRDGVELLSRLREIVECMHTAGLVHLDLRGRGNVLLDADGRIWVLDLASAVWFRPGGLPQRMFFRWFAAADRAALLKWKQVVEAGPYTENEQEFLRRFRFWRSLWVFNRRRSSKREAGDPW